MPKLPASDRQASHANQQEQISQITALQARVAELEAQAGAQRALQAAAPTERLNTLLAVSAALLVTHDIEALMDLMVKRAVQLFPGAGGALQFWAEGEAGDLRLSAAS